MDSGLRLIAEAYEYMDKYRHTTVILHNAACLLLRLMDGYANDETCEIGGHFEAEGQLCDIEVAFSDNVTTVDVYNLPTQLENYAIYLADGEAKLAMHFGLKKDKVPDETVAVGKNKNRCSRRLVFKPCGDEKLFLKGDVKTGVLSGTTIGTVDMGLKSALDIACLVGEIERLAAEEFTYMMFKIALEPAAHYYEPYQLQINSEYFATKDFKHLFKAASNTDQIHVVLPNGMLEKIAEVVESGTIKADLKYERTVAEITVQGEIVHVSISGGLKAPSFILTGFQYVGMTLIIENKPLTMLTDAASSLLTFYDTSMSHELRWSAEARWFEFVLEGKVLYRHHMGDQAIARSWYSAASLGMVRYFQKTCGKCFYVMVSYATVERMRNIMNYAAEAKSLAASRMHQQIEGALAESASDDVYTQSTKSE